jgi:hypothetical protein
VGKHVGRMPLDVPHNKRLVLAIEQDARAEEGQFTRDYPEVVLDITRDGPYPQGQSDRTRAPVRASIELGQKNRTRWFHAADGKQLNVPWPLVSDRQGR